MTAYRTGSQSEFVHRVAIGSAKGLLAWGHLTRQSATLKAPVRTGRLARSIDLGEVVEDAVMVWSISVGTNVEYAAAQEFGSGIHAQNPADRQLIKIEARRAKALAFEWPGGPKELSAYDPASGLFFFKAVYHPGVPARPYLRPALQENREKGIRLAVGAIVAELRRQG